jgi:anti-sigma factor RsiW
MSTAAVPGSEGHAEGELPSTDGPPWVAHSFPLSPTISFTTTSEGGVLWERQLLALA